MFWTLAKLVAENFDIGKVKDFVAISLSFYEKKIISSSITY